VEGEIFPGVLDLLKDSDPFVKKNAAILIREIARHTPELSALVVNNGGAAALVEYVNDSKGLGQHPGIMALGYISAFSETMAKVVIDAKGIPPLLQALSESSEEHVKAASAWALGQIGKHSPEHAKAVAEAGGLGKLQDVMTKATLPEDQKVAKTALKSIVQRCTDESLPALESLLDSPSKRVLEYVIHQFAKILPNDVKARRDFVTNGSLQKIQTVQAEPRSQLKDDILTINNCYPEEIVQYYSPGYSQQLLSKIEDFGNPTQAKTS